MIRELYKTFRSDLLSKSYLLHSCGIRHFMLKSLFKGGIRRYGPKPGGWFARFHLWGRIYPIEVITL